MRRWLVVAGCAIVAAVVVWVTFFRDSDEDRIRRVLGRLTKAVAVKKDDTVLSRTGRLRSELKQIVTDDVRVDVPDLRVRVTGRDQLVEGATKAGLMFASADCELTGVAVKIDEAATTAKVDATALVTAERGGERKVDRRAVHFLLYKDGDWRITTIDVAPKQE